MDGKEIMVEGGTIELIGTPEHVNVLIECSDGAAELRLTDSEKTTLADGLHGDAKTDVECEGGVLAWEPGRGLYFEEYSGSDGYVVFSPDDREHVANELRKTEVG